MDALRPALAYLLLHRGCVQHVGQGVSVPMGGAGPRGRVRDSRLVRRGGVCGGVLGWCEAAQGQGEVSPNNMLLVLTGARLL